MFGELSVLLDQPHTAHVRALETSQFLVADATTFLAQDPIAALYVATVLARRLDGANQVFIQLKSQLEAGRPRSKSPRQSRNWRDCLVLAIPVLSMPIAIGSSLGRAVCPRNAENLPNT